MNLIEQIQEAFCIFLSQTYHLDEQTSQNCTLSLNDDMSKQAFGDLNANAAMILAKILKRPPREIAQEIAQNFTDQYVEKIEIAGPGFLNLFLTQDAFNYLVQEIHQNKDVFFTLANTTKKKKYSIEFVSANPTGPLHFGHGRGGIIGDVLGNILKFLGHRVTQEYYINDAGSQIKKLGNSFKIRCQQATGLNIEMPEDGYHGEYLIEFANECYEQYGKALLEKSDEFFQNYAKNHMLKRIKHTLDTYGIYFDIWFSEKTLHDNNSIEKAIELLEHKGYIYQKEGATWFKSTEFGDDKDRVVRKATGELTYAAADIAYLRDKIEREHNHLIMILGHDHHSYAVRLQSIAQALGHAATPLDIILYQLVKIKEDGQQVRMSKRAGQMITLADVIDTVGKDVARFFYLNRKADAQLEFDLELALKKTDENPVYYVQYAYVRTNSILQKASQEQSLQNITPDDAQHLSHAEAFLIKKIISLKQLLANIGSNYQTHLLAYYIHELAQVFSNYYAKHRVIDTQNIEKSRARLLLITVLRDTLELCLKILGISRPKKM